MRSGQLESVKRFELCASGQLESVNWFELCASGQLVLVKWFELRAAHNSKNCAQLDAHNSIYTHLPRIDTLTIVPLACNLVDGISPRKGWTAFVIRLK